METYQSEIMDHENNAFLNYGNEVPVQQQNMNYGGVSTKAYSTTDGKIDGEADKFEYQSGKFRKLFQQHRHETVTYCLVFWAFGMCVALLGPTLLDLGCKTSNMFSTMSWAFFSQSLFTLLGSASGGLLVQKYGTHPVLLVSCSMLTFTLAVIALCDQLFMLALVLGVMGYFMGTIDTVANISMIQLYGKNVAPFLQTLHFFYGLGAFLSPLISMPFLLSNGCGNELSARAHSSSSSGARHNSNVSWPEVGNATYIEHAAPISHIQYAFWIMACLQIPVIIMVATLIFKQMANFKEKTSEDYEIVDRSLMLNPLPADALGNSANENTDRPAVTPMQISLITILTSLLLFLYDGLQASYGGYVYSYAVKSLADLSVPKAAYLNACFWGTFAFGRLISIWLATRLAPNFMLFCNISGCLVAMIMMVSMPHDHVMLYIGTCIFGMFLSSIYPTAITLAENYIPLTSSITTTIVVSAAAGEMSMPVIVGHEFDMLGPISFLGTGLVVTCASAFVFLALCMAGSTITRQSASPGILGALTACIPRQGTDMEDSGLLRHHVKYYSRMRSEVSENSLGEHGMYGASTDADESTLQFGAAKVPPS